MFKGGQTTGFLFEKPRWLLATILTQAAVYVEPSVKKRSINDVYTAGALR